MSEGEFVTEVISDEDPQVARIIIDGYVDSPQEARRYLESALKQWPRNMKVIFTITPGGFITIEPNEKFEGYKVADFSDADIKALIDESKDAVYKVLISSLRKKLASKTKYLTIGADVFHSKLRGTVPHMELVHVYDTAKNKIVHTTGKSYPTMDQARTLIPFRDLGSHFKSFDRKSVCILGCHDLNMVSPRSIASLTKGSEKSKTIKEFNTLMKKHSPSILLHHPHTTDTPRIWQTAIAGLKKNHPYVGSFYSAGTYYNGRKPVRDDLDKVLDATRTGDTIDFVVTYEEAY